MHEAGIAQEILDVVNEIAARHGLSKVSGVRLRIGAMRQIVPDALRFAFEALGRGSVAEGARITIDEVAVRCSCRACGSIFAVEDYDFFCPVCNGMEVTVMEGKELSIDSVEGD